MPVRLAVTLLLAVTAWAGAANGSAAAWTWPVEGHQVSQRFDPPSSAYGPGHRGIDLPGSPGEVVRSVAAGTVRFVGQVAGKGVVVIDHGVEQSTYEPVSPLVKAGQAVRVGEAIGLLRPGHHDCPAAACLHLGRKRGAAYLDPAALLSAAGRFRLVRPDGPAPVPPTGGGPLALPVAGPVTSPFGWRIHPITHRRSFHDGIDFAAACGTVVHAAAPGSVSRASRVPAYGLRVEVRHTDGTVSSYSHLSATLVRVGQAVGTGDVVGAVGSTGLSTGCHLHFSVYRGDEAIDPSTLL